MKRIDTTYKKEKIDVVKEKVKIIKNNPAGQKFCPYDV